MTLLSMTCAKLGRAIARYASNLPSERALYAVLVFLTVASAANVICAAALWALPSQSTWRALASGLVVLLATAVVASYFVVAARRDSMALGGYASTFDELAKRVRKCGLRLVPGIRYNLRDPTTSAPWQDLLVVFFSGLAAIVAARAACENSTSDNDETENRGQGRRKTISSLRSIDADTEHPIRERSCAVCLEPMTEGALSVLPCAHGFHENCIGAWIVIARKRHCPVCKTSVVAALQQTGQSLREQPNTEAGERQV